MRDWLIVAGLAVAGAGGVVSGEPLRVFGNTTTIELAPVLLAAKELGGDVVTVTNGGIPNLYDASAADLATNAETQALRQSVDHRDLRIVLTVAEGFYRIVARRSAGINALPDLRGKKVATIPTTSSGYYLHKMLGTVGMSIDDVTVVPLTPLSRMPTALANREVDAVTIWEPEIERVIVEEDVYIARERGRAPRARSELAVLIDSSVLRDALAD